MLASVSILHAVRDSRASDNIATLGQCLRNVAQRAGANVTNARRNSQSAL